jgi:tetratricopeptide (TPR) repeat protein
MLADLARAHLVIERTPARYTFHDLLRVYATEQAHATDRPDELRAAVHRMLDHYTQTAHTADRLLAPSRNPVMLDPPHPGVTPENLTDQAHAMAWFNTEHPVLVAAVDRAAGFDTHTWQLAWALTTFLDRRGYWQDWVKTQRAGLAAATRLIDRPGQAHTHRGLAHAYVHVGRLDDAHRHLRHALELFRDLGDPTGQAHTHISIGQVLAQLRRHPEALDHTGRALALFQTAHQGTGQANALNNLGWYHAQLGNYQQALTCCQQALDLHQQLGNEYSQAATWDSLGYVHHHLGHHIDAVDCYRNALRMFESCGDRYGTAAALIHLGDTHQDAGNRQDAHDAWLDALTILEELDHHDADQIRAKIQGSDPASHT